jgi:hypothetical protein
MAMVLGARPPGGGVALDPYANLDHVWKLDEASGIAKADSVGTVHMTDYGSANVASSPTAKNGNAMHATAHQTQAVRNITVRTALDTSAGRTWSFWVRPEASVGTLAMRGRNPPDEPEYWIEMTYAVSDYKIDAYWWNTVGGLTSVSASHASLVFGSYAHVFIGFDLDLKIRIAVNGVHVATSAALAGTPRINNAASNLYFMGSALGPDCSTGDRHDEIATWGEQFSAAKAAFMYNGGAGVFL